MQPTTDHLSGQPVAQPRYSHEWPTSIGQVLMNGIWLVFVAWAGLSFYWMYNACHQPGVSAVQQTAAAAIYSGYIFAGWVIAFALDRVCRWNAS